MEVKLISYTRAAERLLVFTKQTRLEMSPDQLEKVASMGLEDLEKELAYMAGTIPSSWEFAEYVFLVRGVSRNCTHQMVRTRNASYAQQSMRVTDQSDFETVIPEAVLDNKEALTAWMAACEAANIAYKQMRALGLEAEDARGILPGSIKTNIVCKYNLRTMSELAKSRTGGRTQDEYRKVANAMCDEVLKVHPWASQFLFPAGRDRFKQIEEIVAHIPSDVRAAILKVVDQMRKEK